MRNAGLLALIAVLCSLATACGGSSKSGSGTTTVDLGPTGAGQTLSIYGFGTGDEIANTRAALAKKAVAPAKVSNPTGGFDDQQFLARVASHTVPDLIYLDRQKVGTYAAKGALLPVSVCGIDMNQFRKPAVQEVTFDGKPYGVPEFYAIRTLIISATVTGKTGVTDLSTTDWPQLKVDARKMAVVSGNKVTRIGFDPKLPEFFPLWAKANGVDLLSKDGRTAHLDDPRAIEALKYAVSLIDEQGGWSRFKAFRDTWDFFGSKNQFARGQVGAFPMEDWYFNVLATNSPDARITSKPFTDRKGDPLSWESGSAWAIPKGAKHVKLACEWAKTMTEVSSWVAAAKARIALNTKQHVPFVGLYTANVKADDKIMSTLYKPSGTQFDQAVKTLQEAQKHSFAIPASPAGNEVTAAWTNAVNRVLAGQQKPAAALKQAQQEAQAAIDSAARG
ncbi:MAG TPA: extracellular solute-binding protein [Gaiellaceae bacterium]|jgi:multiple sugar transport system substrate-binding protein|nr:extracellular solute-binding protein [Gaiellaceae bacterium]